MIYREIGTSGIKASAVAMGTWGIGGGSMWSGSDDAQSVRAIHAALDSGINLLDSAPMYGFGHSEEVIGKALRGIARDKVVVSTKCGLWWKDGRGSLFATREGRVVNRSLDPATIRVEVEDSLRRLGTDYIDVYHTHWQSIPPCFTPVAETMGALLDLKQQGKIRAIAVSNADTACMDAYFETGKLDACQSYYSLLSRGIEQDIVPYAAAHKMSILAYSPLERGLLTGKIMMDTVFEEGAASGMIVWMRPENRIRVLRMLEGWKELTEQYHCTMAQLVIACTIRQEGIGHVLCGARRERNAIDNAKAAEVELSAADMRRMRADAEQLGGPLK